MCEHLGGGCVRFIRFTLDTLSCVLGAGCRGRRSLEVISKSARHALQTAPGDALHVRPCEVKIYYILTLQGLSARARICDCPACRLCLLYEQEEWSIAERLSDEADVEWTDRTGRRRNIKGDQSLVARALREYHRLRALPQ
jgi:hypothetical protein